MISTFFFTVDSSFLLASKLLSTQKKGKLHYGKAIHMAQACAVCAASMQHSLSTSVVAQIRCHSARVSGVHNTVWQFGQKQEEPMEEGSLTEGN